jgi:hypothetical protein
MQLRAGSTMIPAPLIHAACCSCTSHGPCLCSLLSNTNFTPPQACEPSLPSAQPAQLASLTWGLATLGQRPATPWLETLCEAAYPLLDDCHANQIWGEARAAPCGSGAA